ncbi:hypothetical protein [Shewanella aestuarii]|uniref:DUF5683 domain-containing protein n=1 Tax=Shewanella aestuarii TaxID=1028752 RepID=A0A6G9QHP3_9GAMM|nr:hypothetical protein [Shewanella aestuarii]QIR13399.1 hypothetical protein HBH39_01900 [Shewanella aestuarii]
MDKQKQPASQHNQPASLSRAFKASLMSALVFPGSGQMWLGKKWQAMGFITVATICLFVLVKYSIEQAQIVTDKILAGDVALTLDAIYAEISQAPESTLTSVVGWIFVINWLASIVLALC